MTHKFTDQCLSVEVDDVGVGVVRVRTQTLHHERCCRLHAVKQTRVHDTGHLRLQDVLRSFDLLVGEVAECRKVVTAHGLRDADCWVAEAVTDGNICLLITRIKDFLGRYAVHDSV